ncbi:MAG: isocitrate/isopropylmalate family dehydrogenase, partial [Acidiferrobacterales bacterium]
MTKKIAILPGDGIGPEIIAEAVKVLELLRTEGLQLELTQAPVGGAAYDLHGDGLPEDTLSLAMSADAVLLGAVGGPKWDALEDRSKRPEKALLGLRSALKLFSNLRPAILYPQLVEASTLKPEVVSGLDIMIVRELTGGIYFGQPRAIDKTDSGERRGYNTLVYTESEIERIARSAFEIAMKRGRKLCSVDKANVLDVMVLWREVV